MPEYVSTLHEHLKLAFSAAHSAQAWKSEWQKQYYDKNTGSAVLQSGDVVLLKTDAYVGKHKIKDRWGDTPYAIEMQLTGNPPLYQIKDETGRVKTAHRNRLLFVCSTENQPNEGGNVCPVPSDGCIMVCFMTSETTNPKATDPEKDDDSKPHEPNGQPLAPELPRPVPWACIYGQY